MGGAADDDIVSRRVFVGPAGTQGETIPQTLVGIRLLPGIYANHSGKVAGAEVIDRHECLSATR